MFLDNDILNTENNNWSLPTGLYSARTVRGLYNPMQFLVRLHPKIHNYLSSINSGIYSHLDPNVIDAFSTYLHEIIHWWQHIGSTLGIILSTCYPAQAHVNHTKLRFLLSKIGPVKPLRRFHLNRPHLQDKEIEQKLNVVLNNWHDIEFCTRLILSPSNATSLVKDGYFDSIGHSYHIAWSCCIWLLAQKIDPDFEVLPDYRISENAFEDLRKKKIDGYLYGSRTIITPLGAKDIFEGQARFSQIQYLYYASKKRLNWDEFRKRGMLGEPYVIAFESFLSILGEEWPSSVDNKLVGLFLLICDLAINPTDGFPFEIRRFESFISDIDPGIRFWQLTKTVKEKFPKLKCAINNFNREEYIEGSELLCHELQYHSPIEAAKLIASWPNNCQGIKDLMEEDRVFRFSPLNLPVRVFLSRFINFQKDKLSHPEFFTWPGALMIESERVKTDLEQLFFIFRRNWPLYVDVPNGDIRPALIEGRNENDIYDTFNQFYAWNATYNLVRQWIVCDGPFDIDFNWMTNKYSKEEMCRWASDHFAKVFDVTPSQFLSL